jgi:hypothetical protein
MSTYVTKYMYIVLNHQVLSKKSFCWPASGLSEEIDLSFWIPSAGIAVKHGNRLYCVLVSWNIMP